MIAGNQGPKKIVAVLVVATLDSSDHLRKVLLSVLLSYRGRYFVQTLRKQSCWVRKRRCSRKIPKFEIPSSPMIIIVILCFLSGIIIKKAIFLIFR